MWNKQRAADDTEDAWEKEGKKPHTPQEVADQKANNAAAIKKLKDEIAERKAAAAKSGKK